MKAKVKVIKKEDRKDAVSPVAPSVEAIASVDQKEWTTAVKEWVSDFQERRDEPPVPFDSLFDNSKP